MKKLNKVLAVGLSLVMCAGMVAPAFAARYNIEYGDVTIYQGGHSGWNDAGEEETHSWEDDKEVIITGKTDKHNVTVEDGTTANITLKDATIDSNSTGKAAIDIGDSSNLTIELDGINEVKSGDGKAGVSVGGGASLTINDKENDGSLTATGGDGGGAGIGGDRNANSGSVTINGGTITATGGNAYGNLGSGGAGIGTAENGTMDSITINGGNVHAYGTGNSAGIGTGAQGINNFDKEQHLGTISIDGGTVTAAGDTDGAGIGTGANGGKVDTIQITGGNVTATGADRAAGIGTGKAQGWGTDMAGTTSVGKIDIDIGDGESVTAKGDYDGAGIGLASDNFGPASIESINIKTSGTGTVTATGGKSGGAGIGTGYAYAHDVEIGKIDISGSGTVTATGGIYAAGIGTGHSSALPGEPLATNKVGTINISGSSVTATSGSYGAGVGAGWNSEVGNINISGGTVNATGGVFGAGIGAGYQSSFGAVKITGGDITAISGRYATGIGNGTNGTGGTIAIEMKNGSLLALGDLYFAIDTGKQTVTNVNGNGVMNGRFQELGVSGENGLTEKKDTVFVVVDGDGKEIKRFTLTAGSDMYDTAYGGGYMHESFAMVLPEGKYYVFAADSYDNSIAGYETNGKKVAYVISEDDMLNADLIQFPSFNVSFSFSGDAPEGAQLPEGENGKKMTLLDLNKKLSGETYQDIETEDGTWSFNGWTSKEIIDENGMLTDVDVVGTWTFTEAQDNPPEPTDPTDPDPGIDIEDPDVPLGEEPEVEIEDPRVPLAGPFTRADAIGYLWEQTGSPDAELSDFPDVPEDHYWAVAIGWAQDMGIALPDEEGNFRPDDLVLRSSSEPEGELQQFLNRYAVFAGAAEQGETFIQLTGASDDVIMGEEAQVIFDEFFAKLEAALTRKAA